MILLLVYNFYTVSNLIDTSIENIAQFDLTTNIIFKLASPPMELNEHYSIPFTR